MERRRAKRRARRLQVRVTDLREGDTHLGFTTNISVSGTFVAINHLYPPGTRVRAEILDRDRSIMLECVVARAKQVPSIFRGLEQQGIGLRFLEPDELFGEIVWPGDGATAEVVATATVPSPAPENVPP